MENILKMNIADEYGEDPSSIPSSLFTLMQDVIKKLYDYGIEYPDITGYNFIEKNNKVFIIDFGDAVYSKKDKEMNWFLSYFLGGHNGWNPDFR